MRGGSTVNSLHKLRSFLAPHKPVLGLTLVAMAIAACLAAVQPYLIKIAIDDHILKGDLHGTHRIAWILLAAVLIEYGAKIAYTYGMQYAGNKVVAAMRERVYAHLLGFDMAYFDHKPAGVLLSRTISDAESLAESLASGVVSILLDVLSIIGICAMMIWLSPLVSLWLLVLVPVLWAIIHWFGVRLKRSFTAVRHWNAELSGFLDESISGITIIQLFRKVRDRLSGFSKINRAYCQATVRSNIYDASLYALMEGLAALCIGSLLVALCVPNLSTAISVGLIVAFIEYLQRIFLPIKEFSAKIASIQRAAVDLDRIFGILDENPVYRDGALPLAAITRGIHFDHVHFRYRETGDWTLRDLSFEIKVGEKIAIVGKTGSGKSTLVKLLLRHYDHTRGAISIDGIDIKAIRRDDLYRRINLVSQDVFLFEGSFYDNIALGRPGIDRARVAWASRLTHADRFIARYPGAYDHTVRERGVDLSAGEAQLVAFARAMAGDGDLVILDEATGNIDSATEREIEEATLAVLSLKTSIVIAHRLSTLKHVDRILVMKQGEIVESGTHAYLLSLRGEYYRLHEAQYERGGGSI